MDSDFENFENGDARYGRCLSIQVVEKIQKKKKLYFHFRLQTNEQCYRLLKLTNHSSAFPPVSGMKLNVLYSTSVSGTRKA